MRVRGWALPIWRQLLNFFWTFACSLLLLGAVEAFVGKGWKVADDIANALSNTIIVLAASLTFCLVWLPGLDAKPPERASQLIFAPLGCVAAVLVLIWSWIGTPPLFIIKGMAILGLFAALTRFHSRRMPEVQ